MFCYARYYFKKHEQLYELANCIQDLFNIQLFSENTSFYISLVTISFFVAISCVYSHFFQFFSAVFFPICTEHYNKAKISDPDLQVLDHFYYFLGSYC